MFCLPHHVRKRANPVYLQRMRFRGVKMMLFSVAAAVSFALPAPVSAQTIDESYNDIVAQGIIFAGICDGVGQPCACRDEGLCSLNDIMQFVVNAINFILGLSGSIALLMFLWGGTRWVLANGNKGHIEDGKEAMVNASVGLAVIFSAYMIVTFVVAALTGQEYGQTLEQTVDGALTENAKTEGGAAQIINTR